MRKGGLRCPPASICPSVCPSVTLVHCIQTAEDIVKLLSRPSSFLTPAPVPNSKGNPFSGGRGIQRVRNSTEIAVYLGNGTR